VSKKILLTGAPGSGKTTLIHRVVDKYPGRAGGFYTQEIRESGRRKGFEIVTLEGERGILAHVDLHSQIRVSKYAVDIATLERIAVGAIQKTIENGALVVIDEIGPMEINSPRFREAVLNAFSSDCSLLGTIVKRSTRFTDQIKSRQDITLIEVHPGNRDQLVDIILSML
jgi:nucleoside-triphosphatase